MDSLDLSKYDRSDEVRSIQRGPIPGSMILRDAEAAFALLRHAPIQRCVTIHHPNCKALQGADCNCGGDCFPVAE